MSRPCDECGGSGRISGSVNVDPNPNNYSVNGPCPRCNGIRKLRDHSQPCEHDNQTVPDYEGFRIGHWTDLGYWCPGGKEIVLRREWRCRRPDYQGAAVLWCGPDGKHQNGEWGCGYVYVEVVEE